MLFHATIHKCSPDVHDDTSDKTVNILLHKTDILFQRAFVLLRPVNYIAIEMASFSLHLAQSPASIHEGTSHA
jgi:hypothetical protein